MLFANTQYGKFFYFQSDDIGQRIAHGEFFDVHFKPWMDRLKVGSVLVDVGANIGFFSIYAAKRGAEVFAFEASHDIHGVLVRNVIANNVQHLVSTYDTPLYDSDVELMINPNWNDGKMVDYEKCPNSGGLSLVKGPGGIRATRLDKLKLLEVTLLKVDTQGADLRVLVGADETIARCRPIVCFEFEHDGSGVNASNDSLNDFMNFFESLKYRVVKVADGTYGNDYVAEPI